MYLIQPMRFAIGALSLILLTSSTGAAFDDSKSEENSGSKNLSAVKIETYEDDLPKGLVRQELLLAAEKVTSFVWEHGDIFAGYHYTDDGSHYVISVAKPKDTAVVEVRELIATLGTEAQYFQFETVERSRNELEELQMAIVHEFAIDGSQSVNGAAMRKGSTIQAIGIKDSPSKVTVEILDISDSIPLDENQEVLAINEKFPGTVMFKKVFTTVMGDSGNNDVAPHYGGAGYDWWDLNGYKISNSR